MEKNIGLSIFFNGFLENLLVEEGESGGKKGGGRWWVEKRVKATDDKHKKERETSPVDTTHTLKHL